MNVTKHLAAASFALAVVATAGAMAAPPVAPVGTLTIPAPFGSSPVLAWSWGASNSGSSHIGGGGGAGKVNMQDVSLTRYADGQSALFFDAVARGQHLPTVVLVDGLMTITLTDVLVSSYTTGGFADGKDPKQTSPTENITFNFAKITYTVNGATKCFNIPTNTSC